MKIKKKDTHSEEYLNNLLIKKDILELNRKFLQIKYLYIVKRIKASAKQGSLITYFDVPNDVTSYGRNMLQEIIFNRLENAGFTIKNNEDEFKDTPCYVDFVRFIVLWGEANDIHCDQDNNDDKSPD